MNRAGGNGFFSDPETDDTLRNIRREYLASKKNLQELLITSPTGVRTRPVQVPTPPTDGSRKMTKLNDDHLRLQLREGLKSDLGAPRPASASYRPLKDTVPAQYTEIESLRTLFYDQQRRIDHLQRGFESQGARNAALHDRIYFLERTVAKLEAELDSRSHATDLYEAPPGSYSTRNAPAFDFQDRDNTRALLDPQTTDRPTKRQISNYEDSTTRLIQLAQGSNRW
ncbi:LAME_0F04632g1_1 [Lachancea meyersii CBS 8951]|uniref:Spindle pole component 29 n=1 Tax=Lachancea meyersii CBS 8951 TaxID=1266667 RepID=A0A1G4JSE6_9SACH|nr:LAME_0F04632g1_1 [Lachancea meyersii CBS 8951]